LGLKSCAAGSLLVPRQVVLVHAQREPTLADAAPHRDEFEDFVHTCARLPVRAELGHQRGCGCFSVALLFAGFDPPPHQPFAGFKHLVSRQVAGQWKLALLMLLATELMIRLTSDLVKPKANIYNDLRTFTGSAASHVTMTR
jgi:hypothetical protein